jgi:hypothetical protein
MQGMYRLTCLIIVPAGSNNRHGHGHKSNIYDMSCWSKVPGESDSHRLEFHEESSQHSMHDIEECFGEEVCELYTFSSTSVSITKDTLSSLNTAQSKQKNQLNLIAIGGTDALLASLKVSVEKGLSSPRVKYMRRLFGRNAFPTAPMDSYLSLVIRALGDTTMVSLSLQSKY